MKKEIPATINEIHYSQRVIKLLTPYLNDIIENPNENKESRPLTLKHRAFCWYYVFNNHNKTDAYKRAYFAVYNNKIAELVIDEEKVVKRPNICSDASRVYGKTYIREAISRIETEVEAQLKQALPTDLLRQLIIQATYDPAMFIKKCGEPAFTDWDEIPPEYRCCIEGIETRAYGRNADLVKTTLKLVNREQARKYLLQMCPGLLEPETKKHIHTTLDKDGKEVGLDLSRTTTAKLLEMQQELESNTKVK